LNTGFLHRPFVYADIIEPFDAPVSPTIIAECHDEKLDEMAKQLEEKELELHLARRAEYRAAFHQKRRDEKARQVAQDKSQSYVNGQMRHFRMKQRHETVSSICLYCFIVLHTHTPFANVGCIDSICAAALSSPGCTLGITK
jgi:hypothetical protein